MIRTLLLVLWMGLIFYASHMPDARTVPWLVRFGLLPDGLEEHWLHTIEFLVRKCIHVFTYSVLAMLSAWSAFFWWPRQTVRKLWWGAGLFSLMYAVSDEIHQRFVPGRSGEVRDVLIDTLGIAFGLWLFQRLSSLMIPRQSLFSLRARAGDRHQK